jgi:hypothetical protein
MVARWNEGKEPRLTRRVTMMPFGEYLKVPDFLLSQFHGLHAELLQESNKLQPWRPDEFSQRSAAIHEASDFWINWPEETIPHDVRAPKYLAFLRIVLAGRRGELLFMGKEFCLRAGLDELTYALLMIMPAPPIQAAGAETGIAEFLVRPGGRYWRRSMRPCSRITGSWMRSPIS